MAAGVDEVYTQSGITCWAEFRSSVDAVCHLSLVDRGVMKSHASGFLATSVIHGRQEIFVMTSYHFIHTKEVASEVRVIFRLDGDLEQRKDIGMDPHSFFKTNAEFDYTMIGISEKDVDDLRVNHRIFPIKLEQREVSVNENDVIHIPQHPQGKPKRFSSSIIVKVEPAAIYYTADTDNGSSGSPVICNKNDNVSVVALHKSGGITIQDGVIANKGILMSAILRHVNGIEGNDDDNGSRSPGNESGAFVTGTAEITNRGLPVAHPQPASSENSEPSESRPNNVSSLPASTLVQENQKPSSNPSPPYRLVPSPRPFHQGQGHTRALPRMEICEEPFTPKELIRLAQKIPDVWQQVAKFTDKFKDYHITNIRLSHSLHDETLKADRMLNDFKSQLGTRQCLADALKSCGKDEEAKNVLTGGYRN